MESKQDPADQLTVEALSNFLNGLNHTCYVCGNKQFYILTAYMDDSKPLLISPMAVNRPSGQQFPLAALQTKPAVVTACTNCGHIEQFLAEVVTSKIFNHAVGG